MIDLCRQLETARLERAMSYADLGRSVGLTGQQVARICRGRSPSVSIVRMSALLAAVGMDLSSRAYPSGAPVRDTAHLALLARLRARVHDPLKWHLEVPVIARHQAVDGFPASGPIDRRAWDAVIEGPGWRLGVEAETRLVDVQSLERRIALKERDGDVTAVILLVNDTAHNRRVIAQEDAALRERFPGSARRALTRISNARAPAASTLLVL